MTADLILYNGRYSTLDRSNASPDAVAVADGRFLSVGSARDVEATASATTKRVDLQGRRVIPGLIDSHMHIIRSGLSYNWEVRWDGGRGLATALQMLKAQVDRTPAPQWVRVVGGFTEHQFAEKAPPAIDELNAIDPDTPVFILHLYDRALLNGAALRAVGYNKATPNPPGGEIVRDRNGNPTGLLLAQPNAAILYATLAKGPKLPEEYQKNSSRHFMREVNRLGVTGVIDAGGGFQNYPEDYRIIEELHAAGELTVRLAYNLFTQKPKEELADFLNWSGIVSPGRRGAPAGPSRDVEGAGSGGRRDRCNACRLVQRMGLPLLARQRKDSRRAEVVSRVGDTRSRAGAAPVDRSEHVVLRRGRQEGSD